MMSLVSIKLSTLTFLSKLHSISLMPLQRKTKKTGHKLQKIHNFLADQKGLVKKQMLLFGTKTALFLHLIFRIPFDVQNQYFIVGHVTVMVANHVTTPNCKHYNIESFSFNPSHPNISMYILHTVL